MARSGPTTKDTSTIPLGLAQIRVGDSAANIASDVIVLAAAASIGALANTKFTGKVDYWKLESGFPLLEDLSLPIREAASLECAFKELTPYNLALARGIDPEGLAIATQAYMDKVTAAGTTDVAKEIAVVFDPVQLDGPVDDVWTVVFLTATTFKVYGQDTGYVQDGVADGDTTAEFAPDNVAAGEVYFSIPADFFTITWAAEDTYTFRTTSHHAAGDYSAPHSGTIKLGALKAPDFVRMEAVYTYPNQVNHMYVIFPRANVTSSAEIDWAAEDTIASPLTFEGKRADEDTAGGHNTWNDAAIGLIYFD